MTSEIAEKSGFIRDQAFCLLLDENQRLLKSFGLKDQAGTDLAGTDLAGKDQTGVSLSEEARSFYSGQIPEHIKPEPQRTAPVLIVAKVPDRADCDAIFFSCSLIPDPCSTRRCR